MGSRSPGVEQIVALQSVKSHPPPYFNYVHMEHPADGSQMCSFSFFFFVSFFSDESDMTDV